MKKYYSVDEKRGSHASPFSKTRRQIDERRMAESLTAIVGAARTTKLMVTTARGQRCGLCVVLKFLSPNFTIHLSHQIFYLIHGVLNIVLMYTTRRIF